MEERPDYIADLGVLTGRRDGVDSCAVVYLCLLSHPALLDEAAWLLCSCAIWWAVVAIVPRIDNG